MANSKTPSNKDWWSRLKKICEFLALLVEMAKALKGLF
jgi:hypothetical protein